MWVDSADSEPCIGTAGAMTWKLRVDGKLFHSGLPHKGINSLELAMEAVTAIQRRFYADFPAVKEEEEYSFATPSTMKPTQWDCHKNGLNQICPYCTVSGDIRVTPFYDTAVIKKAVEGYVADLNAGLEDIPTRGPVSKFILEVVSELVVSWAARFVLSVCCLPSPSLMATKARTTAVTVPSSRWSGAPTR